MVLLTHVTPEKTTNNFFFGSLSENPNDAVVRVAQKTGSDGLDFFSPRSRTFFFVHLPIRLRLAELGGVHIEPLRKLLRQNIRWGEKSENIWKKSKFLRKYHFPKAVCQWAYRNSNVGFVISTQKLPTPEYDIPSRYVIGRQFREGGVQRISPVLAYLGIAVSSSVS